MLALAWRNLWRQRNRSLATLLAVAVVVALILILLAMIGGLMNAFYQDITQRGGHLRLRVQDYRELRDISALRLPDSAAVLEAVASLETPALAVPVLEVPVLAAGESRSRGVRITGVSYPEALREIFKTNYLSAGELPLAEDVEGIVLGEALATALALELGDDVYIYAPGTEGIGAAAYRLIGLVRLSDPVAEGRAAYLSLAAAQELAAPQGATLVEVHLSEIVRLSQDYRLEQTQRSLQAQLPELSVELWREAEPALAALIQVTSQFMVGIAVLFFILAGLMVVNTTYLSLMERIREFGTIISLGATPRRMMRMIVSESVLLCLTGAAVGGSVGLAAVLAMAQGVTLPEAAGALETFGLPQTFYGSLTVTEASFTIAASFVLGVLAALWPAALAARLDPIEAMRYVP